MSDRVRLPPYDPAVQTRPMTHPDTILGEAVCQSSIPLNPFPVPPPLLVTINEDLGLNTIDGDGLQRYRCMFMRMQEVP